MLKAAGTIRGFTPMKALRDESYRRFGYAPKGEAVYDKRTRTSRSLLFQGTFMGVRLLRGGCKSADFNDWLAEELCPHLTADHVLIIEKCDASQDVSENCRRNGGKPSISAALWITTLNMISSNIRKREYNLHARGYIQEYADVLINSMVHHKCR